MEDLFAMLETAQKLAAATLSAEVSAMSAKISSMCLLTLLIKFEREDPDPPPFPPPPRVHHAAPGRESSTVKSFRSQISAISSSWYLLTKASPKSSADPCPQARAKAVAFALNGRFLLFALSSEYMLTAMLEFLAQGTVRAVISQAVLVASVRRASSDTWLSWDASAPALIAWSLTCCATAA